MSLRLAVEADSVLDAAAAVRTVGGRLDGAPGGAALRLLAVALPGGELARVAAQEAAEWSQEMASLGEVFERYAAQLGSAVQAYRAADAAGAAAVRG